MSFTSDLFDHVKATDKVNFQRATLNVEDIDNSSFADCNLTNATFKTIAFSNTSFVKATLNGAVFKGANFCDDVDFTNADLTGADFTNAEFYSEPIIIYPSQMKLHRSC
jgi:uncharacterized protein YjbI with pentapeptide repeats